MNAESRLVDVALRNWKTAIDRSDAFFAHSLMRSSSRRSHQGAIGSSICGATSPRFTTR